MAAQSIQISLPAALLREIDRRPEAKRHGRSAVVQRALRLYLSEVRKWETDADYARAYGGKADEVFDEFASLMEGQKWLER